jgi:type IV pilus assembly protein PilQ
MMTNLSTIRNYLACACIAVLLAAVIAGCASQNTAQVKGEEENRLITDIVSWEDAAGLSVTVKGNQQLTYTAVKQDAPLGVLFQFPSTGLDNLKEVYYPPENDTIGSIRAVELTENGRTSRIFIDLKRDVAYELSPEGADLTIVFPKTGAALKRDSASLIQESDTDKAAVQTAASKNLAPATTLVNVNATSSKDGAVVTVEADGALRDYKSFTLTETPPRIVFDFAGIRSPFKGEQRIAVKTGPVSQVRHLGYPEKVRLVIETQKQHLGGYTVEAVDNGLLIQVGDAAAASKAKDLKLASGPAAAAPVAAANPATAAAGPPARVNRVEFAEEEGGKSAVIIGTTRPVAYDIVKSGDKQLQMKLANTQVPEQHKRAVITTRFEGAVDRVTPSQGKNETLVAIDLREDVPYTAEQVGNVIRINFAGSTVPPKPYENAEPPAWKTGLAQAPAAVTARELAVEKTAPVKAPVASAAPKGASAVETGPGSPEKVYTGEKIALDFYDTDIKNVFRILQEISGKNFAIDKNVTGKVTLALQKPVPWDQVLDLVLKMNQLGMTREGDIIRIASLATLQQEEKLRQAQLKAEQDSKKQEEEGEPLQRAYFLINYADAKTQILPYLTSILTPNRGKVTVDERNNQIVFRDIAEKVKEAKEYINKVDQPTSQVIIEARVVEANSTFTREVGFDWGTVTLGSFKIGGDVLFGPTTFQSNNIPPTFNTNNSIGFNFTTLTGTPFSIVDAKIQASEIEGKTNIISAPKIVTMKNQKASIKQGLEVPYLERDSSGNATVKFKNVDLLLDVTPKISADRRIEMDIFITKNDVVDPTAPEPALSTNEAKTKILVDDGDTIVIGGILKDTKKTADQGIPGLRKLPALGWLFSSNRTETSKNELLIFITPRIVQLEQRKAI